MACSCRSRARRFWICLPATSDAMREKPVKNSIRCDSRASRRAGRQDHRGHGETAVRAELDQVGPAIGGPDLVLAADILADDLLLDPDRLLAQILGRGHPALQRPERVDEAHREGRARAQARARRQVGVVVDLEADRRRELAQHGADGRMLDLADLGHRLDLGIDDLVPVLEERRQLAQGDVAVLVDRGAEHGPAMLLEPGGIVGAAAEEGDAKGRAGDDHAVAPAAARTAGAAARLAGVPISMKWPVVGKAAMLPGGSRSRRSRSSEHGPMPASRSSSVTSRR